MQPVERAGCDNLQGKWVYNEMEEKKRDKCFEFLKHFWRPMPIMIWLAILIDWMDFAVLCNTASHQRPHRLVRGVEDFGRDRGLEEEFGTEVQSETNDVRCTVKSTASTAKGTKIRPDEHWNCVVGTARFAKFKARQQR